MSNIVTANERSEVELDASVFIGTNGAVEIDPRTSKYFNVEYKPKRNEITLKTGGFVGFIPINRSLTAFIRPKVPISNMERMIRLSGGGVTQLNFVRRLYGLSKSQSEGVDTGLISLLVELATCQIEMGIHKEYVSSFLESSSNIAKISLPASIRHHWSRGRFERASINQWIFTANLDINRMIYAALCVCKKADRELSVEDRRGLQFALERFGAIAGFDTNFSWELASSSLTSVVFASYEQLFQVSAAVLTEKHLELQTTTSQASFDSLIVDLADIFEKYIHYILGKSSAEFLLESGNEFPQSFYSGGAVNDHPARPDHVLRNSISGRCLVIGDSKYKEAIRETDRYQVVAHALVFGANHALIISPQSDSYSAAGGRLLGTVGACHSVRIWSYSIDLNSVNMFDEEEKLRAFVQKIPQTK